MKYIIVTDTHLGFKNGSDQYHNICLDIFNEIAKVAKEKKITTFIHGGDFFNTRKSISLKSIPIAYEIGNILKSTFENSYVIVGNHDIYYKDRIDPTSLQILSEYITIVDKPMIVNNIHLQPWLIDEFVPTEVDYLIGHFEMLDIVINRSGTKSKVGASTSIFKNYKKVLSGHYHTKSETSNIIYLGAPYHMTFNDNGERGFYIFNDENGSLEFIEFDRYPKFIIFDHMNIDFSLINGNNIKVVFTKDIGTAEINKIVNKINDKEPNQLFVEFSFNNKFDIDNVNNDFDFIDVRSIEKRYIDSLEIPDYIKREIIDYHMDDLWKKIKND